MLIVFPTMVAVLPLVRRIVALVVAVPEPARPAAADRRLPAPLGAKGEIPLAMAPLNGSITGFPNAVFGCVPLERSPVGAGNVD